MIPLRSRGQLNSAARSVILSRLRCRQAHEEGGTIYRQNYSSGTDRSVQMRVAGGIRHTEVAQPSTIIQAVQGS